MRLQQLVCHRARDAGHVDFRSLVKRLNTILEDLEADPVSVSEFVGILLGTEAVGPPTLNALAECLDLPGEELRRSVLLTGSELRQTRN